MLNIGLEKFLVLFAVALVVLGPEELPKAARHVGRAMAIIRELRDRAEREIRAVGDTLLAEPSALRSPEISDGGPGAGATGDVDRSTR